MRKKTAWILIFFMLFTFLGQAAKAKELVPCAAGRYSAGIACPVFYDFGWEERV